MIRSSVPNPLLTIVYISPNILSHHSAAAINIMEMCNAFSKEKCNIHLCVPRSTKDKDHLFKYYGVEHPFKVIEIKLPKIFYHHNMPGKKLIFAILAARRLRQEKDYLIYTRSPWVFYIMSVIYKFRCFFEAHQFRYERFMQSTIYRSMVRRSVVKGNGVIICISEALKKQWKDCGISEERLFVAHDGVNINKFHNSISKEQARKQLEIEKTSPIVVYTGSLLQGKGVDVLLESANLLPETHFFIVGGNLDQIAKLKKIVQHENVTFTGQVHPSQIPLYQAAADILALPNTKGSVIDDVTSPMKLFEYIASNRPIVATDIPSIMEILVNNHNALISQNGNSKQLSRNINKLISNPSLCEHLTKNAWQLLDNLTWDSRAFFLLELFSMHTSTGATAPQGHHPIGSFIRKPG